MAKRRYFWAFYLLQLASLLSVLVPFFRSNNLLEWDFPGHYAAIWYLKEYLLPWPTGWNPYHYCGYPQGLFYPPLAHFLAALLSLPFGVGMAMKLLIAASLVLLPVAFYAFSRRWGLDDFQSAVCSTWMTAILFLSGDMFGAWTFGSDLHSMLNVGLFANTLSLPILFAFMARCGAGEWPRNWKVPALLLGLLILIHPLSSLIAGLFMAAHALALLWRSRQQTSGWKPLLMVAAVGMLLGSYWVFPFVSYRAFMNPEFTSARWSAAVQFVVVNGVIVAIAAFSKVPLRPLILTYLVLCNFILAGTLWKLDFQFTRLTIYLLFFLPAFLLVWIRSRLMLLALAVVAVAVGVQGYRRSGLRPEGVAGFSIPDFGTVSGRILSVSPPSHLPSYHVNHDLITIRTGNASVLGLFIESSLNGRFLGNLVRTLDPDAYVWGTPTESPTSQALGKDYAGYILERLRLFDITYLYTNLKLEDIIDPSLARTKRYVNSYPAPKARTPADSEKLHQRYNTKGELLDFYLYPVGSSVLAEPLPYLPAVPASDWKLTNQKWFMEARGVPIFTDRPLPPGVRPALPGEQVEIVEMSRRMDRMALRIHAGQDIPVLVRVGYFPSWKLTLNGQEAPVYRASPNLMLVFGTGAAILEFKRPWQEHVGLGLSLLGVALLGLLPPRLPGSVV